MDQAAQIKIYESVLAAFRLGDIDEAEDSLKAQPAGLIKQIWLGVSAAMAAENDYVKQLNARERAFSGEELSRAEGLRFANMHIALGTYDCAQTYVDELLAENASDPETARVGSDLHRWRGEIDLARNLLAKAHKTHPDNPEIMQGLLDLSKDEDVALVANAKRYVETDSKDMTGRRRLAFTLARRADKSGQYDDAWHYGVLGNSLYQTKPVSDIPRFETHLQRALTLYEVVPFANVRTDTEIIYVVGPPRSGGSLLQSILAAHTDVTSVGERGAMMGWLLPILDQCLQVDEALYNWNLVAKDLPASDVAGMRSASSDGKGAKLFADKMPHHAHVAGLLYKLHPSAKFIDVRRDPFDVALSIFLRDFSGHYDHTRSFSMIADYLRFQRAAITKWERAGVPIIRHNHSKFLNDPKNVAKSLFDKLGLAWDDNYLVPENRKSMVPTFSSVQVRDNISKAYSGKGQNYKQFMDADTREQLERLTD